MERHVKFVAEASAQVERFDQQRDESFDKEIKSRKLPKTFDAKKQFKYSALVNRVTFFICRMGQN